MSAEWHAYPGPQEAAEACAGHIVDLLEDALLARQYATLAVSGGTTARHLFEKLVPARVAWDRIHLFWTDERAVPPSDSMSNYRLAEESLILPAHVPRRNVHRIQAELAPDTAAGRYSDEIREFFGLATGEMPQFDVIHLGMGADAHTASLFPGEALIDDREGIAAAVCVEKLRQHRITLLPGALLGANRVVFLVMGSDKAEAVRAVINEPHDPKRYPAQIVRDRNPAWFLDDAAAALLRSM